MTYLICLRFLVIIKGKYFCSNSFSSRLTENIELKHKKTISTVLFNTWFESANLRPENIDVYTERFRYIVETQNKILRKKYNNIKNIELFLKYPRF